MKAPDTIYIHRIDAEFSEFGEWATTRHADTDTPFVRAGIVKEYVSALAGLVKTVEAQKAEIEDLRDLLASTSLDAGEHIAALQQTVAELRAQVTLSLEKQKLMASLIDRFCEWIDARPQLSNSAIWKVYRDSVALASPPAADPSHICAHGKDAIERCHQCEAAGAFFQPATGDAK